MERVNLLKDKGALNSSDSEEGKWQKNYLNSMRDSDAARREEQRSLVIQEDEQITEQL